MFPKYVFKTSTLYILQYFDNSYCTQSKFGAIKLIAEQLLYIDWKNMYFTLVWGLFENVIIMNKSNQMYNLISQLFVNYMLTKLLDNDDKAQYYCLHKMFSRFWLSQNILNNTQILPNCYKLYFTNQNVAQQFWS